MIKFKDILTEAKWTERKFGDRLPTLEDYINDGFDNSKDDSTIDVNLDTDDFDRDDVPTSTDADEKKENTSTEEITINGKQYRPLTESVKPKTYAPQLEIKAFWDRVKVRQYKREMPKQIIRETIKDRL